MDDGIAFQCAFEGSLDEVVVRRLLRHVGALPGDLYRQRKSYLLERLQGFNASAQTRPWIVVVDLDHDTGCAPEAVRNWLPAPSHFMNFRVAVREVEAWILADRERLARYLQVPEARITGTPEEIDYPKEYLINCARESSSSAIRKGIVPTPGGRRAEGPAYLSLLSEFVNDAERGWRPDVASDHSESLERCIRSLQNSIGTFSRESQRQRYSR
jgi:hypothetical protein